MTIEKGHIKNLETLERASADENLALMECTDAITGLPVIAICAVSYINGEYSAIPLAKMFDGNPYEELVPPTVPEGKRVKA